MNSSNKLTLEQEFILIIYTSKIKKMNNCSKKKYLKKLLNDIIIKDNIIKYYLKNSMS
uniref:Uncharacterized protein ycf18 n=1 Tax=Nitophyllum punctatum TaxID=158729 RepID=A0A4D6WX02_9FLOR|nr:gbilisome degradation protein [Nitophyllum punctatum]